MDAILYETKKDVQLNGKITPTAMEGLKVLSRELDNSRQELYERLGRRTLPPNLFPKHISTKKRRYQKYSGAIAPQLYREPKTIQYNAKVTSIGMEGLNKLSQELQLSKQELIERLGRRTLPRHIFEGKCAFIREEKR